MRNPKYHIYLSHSERRTVINSLIDLRNDLISRGKYTDIIDELLIKLTKTKVKKIKIKEIEMSYIKFFEKIKIIFFNITVSDILLCYNTLNKAGGNEYDCK